MFYSDVGEIVVKVCAEILNMAIVVVTLMGGSPYILFLPTWFCCDNPLYLAYNISGLGYYNSTRLLMYRIYEGMYKHIYIYI